MPLFRRAARPPVTEEPESLPLTQVEGACRWSGCPATRVTECSYVDRRGRGCATTWCPEHLEVVAGEPHCRRHALVRRALGDALDRGFPDIETRAPSLVTWVSRDLARPVTEFLQALAPDATLVADAPRLVTIGRDRVRTWEVSWGLSDHRGFIHRVELQVAEDHDDEIVARLDGAVIGRAVPPWITARRSGESLTPEEDSTRRQAFYSGLLQLLADRIAHPVIGAPTT